MTGRRSEDVPTNSFIWQAVQQNDEKAEEAHKRLRESFNALEDRYDRLREAHDKLAEAVSALRAKPVDAASLIFSAQSVIAIVFGVSAIIGGSYLVNWGQRNDLNEVKVMLNERSQSQDKTNDELRAGISTLQKDLKATEDRLRGEIRLQGEYAPANKRRSQ